MDRQAAAVHYIEQAEFALLNMLRWCDNTYGHAAADKVARMFMDKLFGENLLNYCDVLEVLELWGTIGRHAVADRTYGAEFIVSLHQHFSMFVEPPTVPTKLIRGDMRDGLTALGTHLVGAIALAHPAAPMSNTDGFKEELEGYLNYFNDVPTVEQVTTILTTFPWMAPLYLLSLSNSDTLKAFLAKFTFEPGQQPEAGGQ